MDDSQRERLILEHLPLLHHVVGRLPCEPAGGLDREDLCSIGMLGLIAAADAWDASRGPRFSTYAYPRIRGAILDELRKLDFLPRGRREKLRALERAFERLEQRSGAPPSPEELARELGVPLREVDEALVAARSAARASLDAGGPDGLAPLLRDPRCADPGSRLERQEQLERTVAAIRSLPAPERDVITLYYAEELLLREIGELLGVSESRVSQIHSRALYRLNRSLCAEVARRPGEAA